MAGRQIVIEFLGKDRGLNSATASADSRTSKLGATLKNVGKFAAVGLAAGAVVAGKALFDMTKAAIEDDAAQQKLATSLKNTTGANDKQIAGVEDWISKQGRLLGVTDDELRPAFQRLAEATGDVGKAQKLSSLAMDVSAGTGKSLEQVSTALMKAQNGQVSSLSRLGINTKNAKGETISFEQATKKMADTFGGQAATKANTLQGKMGRLKLIFDETKETIGAKLIPIVTKMADWFLSKGLPAIQKFGGWLSQNLGPIFSKIGAVVRKVFGGMNGDVKGPLKDVVSTIKSIVSIIKSLWNRFGKTIIDYARKTFQNVRQVIGGAFKVIAGIFKVFSSLLKGDWRGVWDGIKMILRGAWSVITGIVKQAWNLIKAVFRIAGSALKGIFGGIWGGLKTLVSKGVGGILDLVRAIPGKLRDLGGFFADAGKAIIGRFVDGLKNAAGVVGGIAGNVWDAVRGMINSAIDKINAALEFTIHLPGPDITINPGNIPHLAKGGIVRARPGGTLALLGEAGSDEAVIPLSGPHARGTGGGTENIVVKLYLDGKEIHTSLLKRRRTIGTGLALG